MSSKRTQPVSPARRAAFDILNQIESRRAFADVLIAALPNSGLSREDRALTQEIVLGVLRWRRALDYFIERYSARSISKIDLPVLIALRIGLYQLRHLERIPQSAAVNESVNLVKRARVTSAAPMVNAVLRQAARAKGEKAGADIDDPLERASIEFSHPRWLLERWQKSLTDSEARLLAIANNSPPPTTFRINTLLNSTTEVLTALEAEGVSLRKSVICRDAWIVESGSAASLINLARRGAIYFQDEASQLVSFLLDPRPAERILDLCAAPGSKTTHLAALSDDRGWIVACDRHIHRLATLRDMCRRLVVKSVDALTLDATHQLPLQTDFNFDRVLVDAPCSGTGTLRANPEIKWRLKKEDIDRLAELQFELLTRAADRVAVGGRLVYSTCSLEREENESVVSRFLAGSSMFRQIEPDAPTGLITAEKFVRTWPHRDRTDGFFAAVLERVV
jgi:16S rRNA (cytosine967-C5)-methyltransferase